MSKVMERPDAADRRHDTLSEHQEVIRAIEPAVGDVCLIGTHWHRLQCAR